MESKLNIGLTLSRDFQNVKCEFVEEKIEYENNEELRAKIRNKFNLIKNEIDLQFERIRK